MNERELFEAWAAKRYGQHAWLHVSATCGEWEAWQEGRASKTREAAPPLTAQTFVRPTACCEMGSYACQVPMPLTGRVHGIDYCIADIVAALSAANLPTVASCCGHGNESIAVISLADGRELHVSNHTRFWESKS